VSEVRDGETYRLDQIGNVVGCKRDCPIETVAAAADDGSKMGLDEVERAFARPSDTSIKRE
jgi:hypothetical protein